MSKPIYTNRPAQWIPGAATSSLRVATQLLEAELGSLQQLDEQLYRYWNYGRNLVLGWSHQGAEFFFLIVPFYAIAAHLSGPDLAESEAQTPDPALAEREEFLKRLIIGSRALTREQLAEAAARFGVEPLQVADIDNIGRFAKDDLIDLIDRVVKRYSISYVEDAAVVLFDIVGFSLLRPVQQLTQLNSLIYSLNSAYQRLVAKGIPLNFEHSTTGDGFYIWDRAIGLDAKINLYHFMHLILADNAIARSKSRAQVVPKLKTAFHVGNYYQFHQPDALRPTWQSFIVGDVTIELARLIEAALPEQILVGEFRTRFSPTRAQPGLRGGAAPTRSRKAAWVDTTAFIASAQKTMPYLSGTVLAGDEIRSIQCYLTGEQLAPGRYAIGKFLVRDKHGLSRNVYNAKVNIQMTEKAPIYLGLQHAELRQWPKQATSAKTMPG